MLNKYLHLLIRAFDDTRHTFFDFCKLENEGIRLSPNSVIKDVLFFINWYGYSCLFETNIHYLVERLLSHHYKNVTRNGIQ